MSLVVRAVVPRRILIFAVIVLGLSGCGGPLVEAGQPAADAGGLPLSSSSSLGQSFMAYQGGLEGIEFRLTPAAISFQGRVTYELRRRADAPDVLARGVADVGGASGDLLRVSFQAQSAERLQDYYVELQYAGPDGQSLLTGPASAYLNGAAYIGGQPQEAQLSFRLLHDPARAAAGLASLFGQWLLLGIVAAMALVLPGLALVLALPAELRSGRSPLDLALLAPALSVAVYPLLIIFTGFAGMKAGPAYAWVPILVGAFALAVRLWRRRRNLAAFFAVRPRVLPEQVATVIVIGLVVFTRLWAIRALDAPMWGDSYQHSVITQLLIERGGLFDDWKPYAEMMSLTYHIGFHSVSAVFGWITGLSGAQSVLWMGQFLNIAAVLAVYPLARRMTGAAWAGVIAMGVAGLVSIHPAFYVNWGRYTQLTGQVALPGVMWLVWTAIARAREPGRSRMPLGLMVLSGLAWAGLGLAHYRILILGVLFAAVAFPAGALVMRSRRWGLLALLGGSALGMLLFVPWLARTSSGAIASTGVQLLSTPASQTSEFVAAYNSIPDIGGIFPVWIWGLVLATLTAGLWIRKAPVGVVFAWALVSIAATNPNLLNLPGTGIISNFALLIFAYIPVSLILAWGGSAAIRALVGLRSGWAPTAIRFLAACLTLLAVGTGLTQRISDVQPVRFALFQRPDARAASWIRANTPPDAQFLVNSFAAYGGSLTAGSDGGWWLPLSAGRATTQPPLNYGNEREPVQGYIAWINALPNAIKADGLSAANIRLLKDRGVGYIYVGHARGTIGAEGAALLDPTVLLQDVRLKLLYRQDRVLIFGIDFDAAGIAAK